MKWEKEGFEGFSKGKFGNGGQNLYVSKKGVLQRIYNYDLNGDGYFDLLFANSQSMSERPDLYVFDSALKNGEHYCLPSGGSYDAVLADITGDGYDDLIIACQNNGTHTDITAYVYFGCEEGLGEKYRMELPAPNAISVAAGDFRGVGKNDVAFICHDYIRVFPNTELGIISTQFYDIKIEATSIAAADLDGDGYCDLYIKMRNDSLCVLWGSGSGLSEKDMTMFVKNDAVKVQRNTSTQARVPASREWRASAYEFSGKKMAFSVQEDNIVFWSFADRSAKKEIELACPGAISIDIGDVDGDGYDDIAVAVCTDKNKMEQSVVFWGSDDGFSEKAKTLFETQSAQSMLITDLEGNGKNQLVVCQGGNSVMLSTNSKILEFGSDRSYEQLREIESEDAMKIVAGKTKAGKEKQLIVINHEGGRMRGDEDIYIFLGGGDGFDPQRRMELPGWAAVQGLMYDYNDDGYVDVMVTNCAENAPHLDPGSFLYPGGPDGPDRNNRVVIPTTRAHGTVVGDFRHSGYLDMAAGGFSNREILIFRCGENGYDTHNPQRIVLGLDTEGYSPGKPSSEGEGMALFADEKNKDYGEVRFLFTADFNGDGWLDIFVPQITGKQAFILWGGPEGFSTERMQRLAAEGACNANAADLNGNGYLDLVVSGHMATKKNETKESYITIYWGGPEGFKESRKTQLPVYCSNANTIADFDGDGNLDIYSSAYNSGRHRDILSQLYFGNENGTFSIKNRQELFNHSGSGCLAGDFNGNGYTDLAVTCHKNHGDHHSTSLIYWGGPGGLSQDNVTKLPTLGPHGMCNVDPGNIMDRGEEEYYYSEIYEVPEDKAAAMAHWQAENARKTWVHMHVRHAQTKEELENEQWRGIGEMPIRSGDDISGLGIKGGFMQYRLTLGAKCFCGTPRVKSVAIEFE